MDQSMDDRGREERTRRIIADSERLIEEARTALEAGERLFAAHGIDPADLMEAVRRAGGERAVRQIEEEVAASMQRIREETGNRLCIELQVGCEASRRRDRARPGKTGPGASRTVII